MAAAGAARAVGGPSNGGGAGSPQSLIEQSELVALLGVLNVRASLSPTWMVEWESLL